jgi:hypothetical protein
MSTLRLYAPVLRLYAPAEVVGLWAGLWWLGVRSSTVIGIFLAATAIAIAVAELERQRLKRRA